MVRQVAQPFVKIWKPLTLEHAAENPMTFEKEADLRAWCKREGVSSGALL